MHSVLAVRETVTPQNGLACLYNKLQVFGSGNSWVSFFLAALGILFVYQTALTAANHRVSPSHVREHAFTPNHTRGRSVHRTTNLKSTATACGPPALSLLLLVYQHHSPALPLLLLVYQQHPPALSHPLLVDQQHTPALSHPLFVDSNTQLHTHSLTVGARKRRPRDSCCPHPEPQWERGSGWSWEDREVCDVADAFCRRSAWVSSVLGECSEVQCTRDGACACAYAIHCAPIYP
jgi:hypothetical protein